MKYSILLLLLVSSSCSRLQFAANGAVPITWGAKSGHATFVTLEGMEELYLWGIVHSPKDIALNREFAKTGAVSVSKLEVESVNDWDVWWRRIVSLGFYWPQKWRAHAFVKKPDTASEQ